MLHVNPIAVLGPIVFGILAPLISYIAYTVVRMEDIVHHLLFVGTFGFVNFLMSWGALLICCFFS